ncbi:VCBS repeat-containing protein [Nitrospira defluvii]|nr:VCBS repeat-containing protein [Nitrospira defluvii]
MTASLTGYDTVAVEVNAILNNIITFSPKLYPQGTTPLGENTAGVTGIVLDAGTNTPLPNVTVTATSGTIVQTLQTGSDGRFTVNGFTLSSADLQFTLEGYAPSGTNLLLDPLQILDIGQVRMRVEAVVQLLPDLTFLSVDRTGTSTNLDTLDLSGTLILEVGNIGTATASSNIELLAFQDSNLNNIYDESEDLLMGQTTITGEITVDGTTTVSLSIQGVLPFLDAPVHVWVDSGQTVTELKEDNNIETTAVVCESKPDIGTFDPVLKWAWEGSTVLPNHRQVMSIPIVAPIEDTNGDGIINENDIPGVIFHTFSGGNWSGNGVLRAISGKDGHDLWSVTNPIYRTNASGAIAVADIDNDGIIEILVGRNGSGLLAFEHDGTFKWESLETGVINWGGPAIADLEGDGTPEIVIGDIVLNADGTLRWRGPAGASYRLSLVADINLDGRPEIIADGKAYSGTGELLWQNPSINGRAFSAIGNFNSDPYPEIAVTYNSNVYLLDHLGSIIWGPVAFPGRGGGAPTVADMDGDGLPEIGVAGSSRYVVFDTDGSILWQVIVQDFSSASTGSSVFDFDGDGSAEVVYGDERFLRVYHGEDGELLFEVPNTSGTTFELPVIVDVDNDNHADIVVVINDYFISGFGSGIRVYEDLNNSWVNTRKIWNQHTYHIDNINDDGTVPTIEENSWKTHNTYRLNAKPNATAVPDLTASLLEVIDNGTAQPLSLSVRVGNGGAISSPDGVVLSFYKGDPNAGGILLGSRTIGVLPLGAYQDVTLDGITSLSSTEEVFAVVDSDNQVIECKENNNTAKTSAAIPQTFLGQIDVSTDNPSYNANAPVALNAVIINLGALSGLFNVELRVDDENGVTLQTFGPRDIGALAGGASITITENWNTEAFFSGSYHLQGVLRDNTGLTLSVATSPFAILPGGGAISTIVTDKATYSSNESVRLTSALTSQSVNSVLTDLGATITVLDPSGAPVFSETRPLSDLLPEARVAFDAFFNTSTHPAGLYSVTVQVNGSGSLLTTASTGFEILSSLAQANALSGTIEIVPDSILETESTTITYSVLNTGNDIDLPVIAIEVLVVDPDTGFAVRTITDETALNGVEVFTNDVLFDSTGLSPKPYLLVLRGITAGIVQTLDSAGLQVNPSPNSAPTADAGPDQNGLTGQLIVLDGTGSSDPDGDLLNFQWHFISVPTDSLVTDAILDDATTPNPSFVPDLEGIYVVSLVVNNGLENSAIDTVSIFINPAPQVDIHPETINLKSNGGSKSITGVLTSPVLSSFEFLTAEDGVTVTTAFSLENQYIDVNGELVVFDIPADIHPASDFIEAVDADGNGTIDLYRLTLKFNRDLLIAGVTDINGLLRIAEPTDLISTVIGDGQVLGSDTNLMIAPPKVSKGK